MAWAIPGVSLLIAVAAMGTWLARGGLYASIATPRLPGQDRVGIPTTTAPANINLSGVFARGPGEPATSTAIWSGFRGPDSDNVSKETTPLLKALEPSKLKQLWEIPLGEGYAGPAIRNGRVYLLDYDAVTRADAIRCLSLDDGREIWRRAYSVDVKRNHGMSRTVPAVSDKYLLTLGPKCQVVCLDATTGDYKWGMDLPRQYQTKIPPWYAGQCPLIDQTRAILAPGGSSLMIAVDCETGKVLWETPNPRGWEMTHTSILPMEFGGVKTYVYVGSGGVAGVDAETGKLLWDTTAWRVKIAAVPSPVSLGDGRIFLSGGYDAGCMMIQLEPAAGGFAVKTLWSQRPATFGSEQQTPIFHKGAIYGAIPGGVMVCLDPATGKQRWTSGQTRFGIGPYLIANDTIYITSDTGLLTAIAAQDQEYQPLGSAKIWPSAHEAWGPMALADGRLLVRDLTRLVCLDLREK